MRSDVVKYQATMECFGVDNTKLISLIKRAEDDSVRATGGADGADTESAGAEDASTEDAGASA